MCAKSLQSYPTLCDPLNYSLPGFSVHGILQAWILEWVAMLFSRGPSQPRGQTYVSCVSCVSCISRWVLYHITWHFWIDWQWSSSSFVIYGRCLSGHLLCDHLRAEHPENVNSQVSKDWALVLMIIPRECLELTFCLYGSPDVTLFLSFGCPTKTIW